MASLAISISFCVAAARFAAACDPVAVAPCAAVQQRGQREAEAVLMRRSRAACRDRVLLERRVHSKLDDHGGLGLVYAATLGSLCAEPRGLALCAST